MKVYVVVTDASSGFDVSTFRERGDAEDYFRRTCIQLGLSRLDGTWHAYRDVDWCELFETPLKAGD